jgi:hypothetical protein
LAIAIVACARCCPVRAVGAGMWAVAVRAIRQVPSADGEGPRTAGRDDRDVVHRHRGLDTPSEPARATVAPVMNTRVAPFDRVAARRALNFAIDRRRIARVTNNLYPMASNSRSRVQIAWFNWLADYPAPSDFVSMPLSCGAYVPASVTNLNEAEFCSRQIDGQIRGSRTKPPGFRSTTPGRTSRRPHASGITSTTRFLSCCRTALGPVTA